MRTTLYSKKKALSSEASSKCRLKVGDTVIVLSGASKGATGDISSIDLINNKVIVKGVNQRKKALKPTQSNQASGIGVIDAPLALSNVAYYEASKGKASRIGYRMVDGQKRRYAKSSGELISEKDHTRQIS